MGRPKQSQAGVKREVERIRRERAERLRVDRQDSWIEEHVTSQAWWPSTCSSFLHARRIAPAREVSEDGLGISGSFLSAKMGRNVQFESSLEHDFFLHLENAPAVRWYHEQPAQIAYEWQGQRRTYIPDCLVCLSDGRVVLVEIKPHFQMLDAMNRAKLAAAHVWCQRNSCGLLFTDGRVGSLRARLRLVEPSVEAALVARLGIGPLGWPAYLQLAAEHAISSADLTTIGLRYGWAVERRPWRIYDPNLGPAACATEL